MIVTLTGNNSFLLRRRLDEMVAAFIVECGDITLSRVDGETADIGGLQEALTSLPFLASKNMVVLRTPSANKQFTEKAERLLTHVAETTDVILVEPKLDKRSSYYKLLKKMTDFRDFQELDQNGVVRWLTLAATELGATISPADARLLIERVGMNQQRLASELDKLALYDIRIVRPTIELLTEPTPQSTIFQLLEAAFAGNARRSLQLYQEQRSLRVEPPQIIAMLAWQLHILAIVKTAGERSIAQIAKDAKLNPYVVTKSAAIVGHLSLQELKQLIADLLTIDARSKREAIDSDEALQYYLLQLAL
jgi:DNA polymerase-3 subunit delta